MKKILITGTSGYVATKTAAWLGKQPKQYGVQLLNVRDDSWKDGSFAGVDVIVHAAGIVHQPKTKDDSRQEELYRRVNTDLTLELARKARSEGIGQFIFLSTASVYGLTAPFGKTVMITTDTPLEPKDLYGSSKLQAEQGLQALADEHFRVAILRPPMIYGKGCKGNYVTLSKLARKLPVFPKVENRRSMLYIDNLTELIRLLIDDGAAGLFCPQNSEYVNTCDMVSLIAHVHGKNLLLIGGFSWALKALAGVTSMVDKAFGSLCYSRELSAYPTDYCLVDNQQSVIETER